MRPRGRGAMKQIGFVPRFIHDHLHGWKSTKQLGIIGRGAVAHPVKADEWNAYLMACSLTKLHALCITAGGC